METFKDKLSVIKAAGILFGVGVYASALSAIEVLKTLKQK